MIIAVFGSICSGKTTFANYLKIKFGFDVIDLKNIPEHELKETSSCSSNSLKMEFDLTSKENLKENTPVKEQSPISLAKEEYKEFEGKETKKDDKFNKDHLLNINTPNKEKPETPSLYIESPEKKLVLDKFSKKNYLNKLLKQKTCNKRDAKIVIINIDEECLSILMRKSFFRLIKISALAMDRYKNYKLKYTSSFEAQDFLIIDKEYSSNIISSKQDFNIHNNSTIEEFYTKIDRMFNEFNICERLEWEDYFMQVAEAISNRSNCIKQKVGALIVKDFKIIASGYNGTAKGLKNCYEGGCERCFSEAEQGVGLNNCVCIHAEQNAIIEIGAEKLSKCTIYTTCYPCNLCSLFIVQSGIKKVVYDRDYNSSLSSKVLSDAGIEIVKYKKKLISI